MAERREGRGCREPQRVQAEREEAERAAGRGGARRSAAFRPGHGSGAPESVHRGLGELVSGGGPAARAPPAGSPSAGRPSARVPAAAWAPGTMRGEAGRAASRPGWAPRARGGRAEALGEEALGPCARGGGAERGDGAPAGTCLRSRHCAAGARRPPARHARGVCATSSGRSSFLLGTSPGPRSWRRLERSRWGFRIEGTEAEGTEGRLLSRSRAGPALPFQVRVPLRLLRSLVS